jgi:uncharacterized protein (UPF0276 family)
LQVWALFERILSIIGPTPTLIEWDNDVPSWSELEEEAARANRRIDRVRSRVAA